MDEYPPTQKMYGAGIVVVDVDEVDVDEVDVDEVDVEVDVVVDEVDVDVLVVVNIALKVAVITVFERTVSTVLCVAVEESVILADQRVLPLSRCLHRKPQIRRSACSMLTL